MNVRRPATALSVLAAAVVLTAGCGGQPQPQTVTQVAVLTPVMLAARAGCNDFSSMSPTLYATAEGTCMLRGMDLDIAGFASDQARDRWVRVARQAGGWFVTGPQWAVDARTADGASAVRTALARLPAGQRPDA